LGNRRNRNNHYDNGVTPAGIYRVWDALKRHLSLRLEFGAQRRHYNTRRPFVAWPKPAGLAGFDFSGRAAIIMGNEFEYGE